MGIHQLCYPEIPKLLVPAKKGGCYGRDLTKKEQKQLHFNPQKCTVEVHGKSGLGSLEDKLHPRLKSHLGESLVGNILFPNTHPFQIPISNCNLIHTIHQEQPSEQPLMWHPPPPTGAHPAAQGPRVSRCLCSASLSPGWHRVWRWQVQRTAARSPAPRGTDPHAAHAFICNHFCFVISESSF